MKNRLFLLAALLLGVLNVKGQSYKQLWAQVDDAEERDLPKTAMKFLEKIEDKARKEKAYGQLLKSTLYYARLQAEVAPDSLAPAVSRIEREYDETKDVALKAVYATVLSKIVSSNSGRVTVKGTSSDYRKVALANPDVLAKTSAGLYEPFVIKGDDSGKYFGDDLLSVIGSELSEWGVLHKYYSQVGNRRAACLTAAKYVYSIHDLDSLIETYGDLPEACELAIRRCGMMYGRDYDTGQRLDYLRQALQRWGSWPGANKLRNDEQDLTHSEFSARMPQSVVMPNEKQQVKLSRIRNVQELTLRIYSTKLNGNTGLSPNREEDYKKMKGDLKELTSLTRHYPLRNERNEGNERNERNEAAFADYEFHDDTLDIEGLAPGVYMMEFSSPQTEPSRHLYFVSGVRVMTQPMPDSQVRFVVVDARSGQPVAGAKLTVIWQRGWNEDAKTEKYTCNEQGEYLLRYKNRMPDEVFAYTSSDAACPESNIRGSYSYYEHNYNNVHVNIYTDRSIYRPGQKVYANVIVWKEKSVLENEAVSDRNMTLELRDANYKVVDRQACVTDNYGRGAVEFILPTGKLNGNFTITTERSTANIRVEEYKRPTFQVEFPEYKETYQAGDTVHAQGKAMSYAGVPVQGAKVKYKVKRRVAYWWLSYSWYWQSGYYGHGFDETVVHEGRAVTADDGTFTVDMPLTMPDDASSSRMYYHFVVEADVTDQAGETHNGSMSLPLGTKPTALTCDLPQKVRRDQLPEVTFTRRNAAGQEIAGTVRYRIQKLDEKGEPSGNAPAWKECPANSRFSLLNAQLTSGSHRLEAVCEADTIDMKFVVFSLDDQKPATETHDWFFVSHDQFPSDGTPVTVQVGSSDPDLHIVYGIYAGEKVIESGVVKKNRALLNRKFTYQEAYDNGLLLSFAWVKDGKCYQHQQQIKRPLPDKQLRLAWTTFRDRLTPGQQEEWSLKVLTPDGKPADASLMAVLYDKSLDQLRSHDWSLAPSIYVSLPSTSWLFRTWGSVDWSCSQAYKSPLEVPELKFSSFDEDIFPTYYYSYSRSRRSSKGRYRALADDAVVLESRPMMANEAAMAAPMMKQAEQAADVKAVNAAAKPEEPKQEVQLRENLNETAFCYPSLATDKDGSVVLKFTLPECLTTWRFMGVANTPQMFYGSIEGETVAKKDVMVQPNMPRFVRMGDAAQLSARVINTSDHAVCGHALIELSDPDSEKVLLEEKVPFGLEPEKTTSVTFNLSPEFLSSLNTNLLICKVIVSGEGFSDGERHYLPVLPDREYVTKTVPYTQHEPGVKTIDIAALFPQGTTQQKLTVEYTNNPAWLMVQSLPVVGQPWEHSAIDQAASYYSNALAKALMAQSPQVKDVFEQWRREMQNADATADASSLNSQLEKNQELKDVLLAETPWVNVADRETEQRKRLADFFDENGINNRIGTALTKLDKLQNRDGSFSWYEGMEGSTYITVAVAEMLARLQLMAGEQESTKKLQSKAIGYLGNEMVELVKRIKKSEKKSGQPYFPSFTALRWLYICALDGRELPSDVKKANEYLMKLLKKDIKRQTIYEKALTAVILAKRGERKLAADYVQSLKEYTVFTEEMGRYYDTQRAAYSWYDYKIPTEVAAVEAIQTITPDDQQTVDEMRRWLLQEKRTQAWGTPINSVNAIYAFLNGNSPLTTDYTPTVLAIDGTPIETPKATAGIGYVKTAIQQPQGKTFTATKTSEGTSWGAVYAQFLQKTSDIEQSGSGITVKRELLVTGKSGNSPYTVLSSSSDLKVGDRIKVRITIETTRDIDFVQVVDRRAACMEPVRQLSGYHNGAYVSPKDFATYYYYGGLAKGKYTMETEYFVDRAGQYETGTCTVQCAYAPEYRATAPSMMLKIKD